MLSSVSCLCAAPAAGTDEQQREEQVEEEQVRTVRRMVAERFSTNPAYQLLKARFLSSFTLPALLATMPQVTNEEMIQEVEDEEQPFVKKKRGQVSTAEQFLTNAYGLSRRQHLWFLQNSSLSD